MEEPEGRGNGGNTRDGAITGSVDIALNGWLNIYLFRFFRVFRRLLRPGWAGRKGMGESVHEIHPV